MDTANKNNINSTIIKPLLIFFPIGAPAEYEISPLFLPGIGSTYKLPGHKFLAEEVRTERNATCDTICLANSPDHLI